MGLKHNLWPLRTNVKLWKVKCQHLLLRTSSLTHLPQAEPHVPALLISTQPQRGVSTKIGDVETISGDLVDLCQELPGHATCLLLSR